MNLKKSLFLSSLYIREPFYLSWNDFTLKETNFTRLEGTIEQENYHYIPLILIFGWINLAFWCTILTKCVSYIKHRLLEGLILRTKFDEATFSYHCALPWKLPYKSFHGDKHPPNTFYKRSWWWCKKQKLFSSLKSCGCYHKLKTSIRTYEHARTRKQTKLHTRQHYINQQRKPEKI